MLAKLAAARGARQTLLMDRAIAVDKAGQPDEALRVAGLAIEALPDNAKAATRHAELRKKIARR